VLVGWFVRSCVRNHVLGPIILKRLETEVRLQWSTYRKWHMPNPMVTCQMTPRYPIAGAPGHWRPDRRVRPTNVFFLVFVCLCVSPLQGRSNGGISVYTLCPKKGSHQTLGSNFVKS